MTYFINCRSQAVGGAVVDPYVLEGNGVANPPALRAVPQSAISALASGRRVLIATHGFNVSYQQGAGALGNLEKYLRSRGFPAGDVYFGLLWPGDFWIPAINYPFEGETAIDCGARLAAFCDLWLQGSHSISFVSHSLGARVVLQVISRMSRRARSVCLAAGAINRDCLAVEYAAAAENADSISILASRQDMVLKLAFPVGDVVADVLHADHRPFEAALGYNGPTTPAGPPVVAPWQIPDPADYNHGDYLPPSSGPAAVGNPPPRWAAAADFMLRAYCGQPQPWPA